MILVAFVFVVLATVALIIGTLFTDGGVSLTWIIVAIASCLATFVVLGISWMGRRRAADVPTARPEPLGDSGARPAPARAAAPRATTVGGSTATLEAPTEDDVEEVEESVQVVPAPAAAAAEEAPAAAAEEAPAPRKVAPRRVVRRVADGGAAAAAAPAAAPTPTPAPAPAPAPAAAAATSAPAAAATTRKVVKRAAPAGQRTVKRVVRTQAGTGASTGAAGQRTVTRKVVRRPAGAAAAAAGGAARETKGQAARAVLATVKGVGPAKQEALLERFGSLEAIRSADVDEIAEVRGVGPSVAAELKKALAKR